MSSPVIRPYIPPSVQPSQTPKARSTAEARAAQRAFFQQAMGDVTPVRTAPVASAPAQVARAVNKPIPDEPPARIMRPGSFVDLKV
jgi:hypothetical protein